MSDRALGSGIPIPQWMLGKPVSGFDPSTLSPPDYDDDFFQIQFSKLKAADAAGPAGYQTLGNKLAEHQQLPLRPKGIDDGFHGANSECVTPVVSVAKKMLQAQLPPRLRQRRNSKSLPASPLGSPESRRREYSNRFFFLEEPSNQNKEGGSTSSLLDAVTREMRSKSSVPESSLLTDALKPQPSELREMNFWSPTSM